jgi:predicted secreted protein
MRQLLVTCVTALALLAAGCSDNAPTTPPTNSAHGTEFQASVTPHIAVKRGERFSVWVEENASVGDMWQLKQPPGSVIAVTEKDEYVSDSPTGTVGGGGKHYFVFTAKQSGESAIGLYDCFRGCRSAQDQQRSRTYEVHLSVS